MDLPSFEIGKRQRNGVTVLDLQGQLDASASQDLLDAYVKATDSRSATLLLNFSDTTYINSSGIAVLVGLLAGARTERQRLIACGLSEHYREIFEITRLADFISLAAEEESALNEAAQGIEQSS